MGVAGAALGTALAQCITAVFMLKALVFDSPSLHIQKGDGWKIEKNIYGKQSALQLQWVLNTE